MSKTTKYFNDLVIDLGLDRRHHRLQLESMNTENITSRLRAKSFMQLANIFRKARIHGKLNELCRDRIN